MQDVRIADQILPARKEARAQPLRTQQFRAVVAAETRTIRVRTEQVRSAERTLFLQQHQLAAARNSRHESLIQVGESKREFAHQSRLGVSLGQTVSQGEVIGYAGCTGHCFGPHLHFEVRINGLPSIRWATSRRSRRGPA